MSDAPGPDIVVIAGPNGAGKSTSAPRLLRDTFQIDEFVNADQIAAGLSGFAPERVAFAAGRIMLARLEELASNHQSFAFETTLATRTFRPWLTKQIERRFRVRLVFLWLPSTETALTRVQDRVRRGGHDVPADTVRRRYRRGIVNLVELYIPIAHSWHVYDASGTAPRLIVMGKRGHAMDVLDSVSWSSILRTAHDPA